MLWIVRSRRQPRQPTSDDDTPRRSRSQLLGKTKVLLHAQPIERHDVDRHAQRLLVTRNMQQARHDQYRSLGMAAVAKDPAGRVFLESVRGGIYLTKDTDVEFYDKAYRTICQASRTPEESQTLLTQAAKEYERE
ncbi:hypothetical protein [Nocardia sp. NPDC127526]|uniref:hypothetical protein n=1 Tax=Nocardia sp. NPDC127526 TaxID=3345393 RepID=UPI003637C2E3